MDDILTVAHLNRYYGKKQVLEDICFSVKRGEFFSLVGESGCGKTTLALSLAGLHKSGDGEITYHGGENKRLSAFVQLIMQDVTASFDPRFDVLQIITEPLVLQGGITAAALRQKALKVMEQVGLDSALALRRPHELSLGQCQRAAIARALICDPSFLIADEPFASLDVLLRRQIIDLLKSLQQNGLTVFLIAHDLKTVRAVSDTVGVIYRGKLVEQAESAAIYGQPQHFYTKQLLEAMP